MTSTAITSLSEARDKLARFKSSLARHREKVAEKSEAVLETVETAVGGSAAALIEHYGPKNFLSDVDNSALVGMGLVALGMLDMGGKSSEHLARIGNGMLAVEAYKVTLNHVKSK